MKRFFTILIVLITLSFILSEKSHGQCNQNICTAPPAPSLCAEGACILCDPCLLNGYMGQTVPGSNTCDVPGPFCGSIENNQWFAFLAPPTGTVTFNFTVTQCQGVPNGSGIQAEVYSTDDCNNFISVSNCWSPGSQQNGSISATGLQPYCTYYLMVDGWAGDFCDFTINTTDCTTPPAPQPLVISGPTQVCPGSIITYSIPSPAGTCGNNSNTIQWNIAPVIGTILGPNDQASISVLWNNTGAAVVSVTTTNVCFGGQSATLPVIVSPIPPINQEYDVCLGECVTCAGQYMCTPGTFPVILQSWLGCDSIINCKLNPIAPVFNDLGQVTICAPQTFSICNQTFNTCGVFSGTCDNWQGCDSTTAVDLAILNPVANVAPPSLLPCAPGSTITLDGSASTTGCLPNVTTAYSWTGPAGGINGASNLPTVIVDMAGQYCLKVTHSRGGVQCSNTKCVTVVEDDDVPQTPQISGDNMPCPGETVQYTVTPVGMPAPASYTWSTNNGTPVNGNGTTVSVTWPSSGTSQICVTANNDCGSSSPACLSVNVPTLPTAAISGSGNVCAGSGQSVDLTIALTGVSPWVVEYDVNGSQDTLVINSSPYTFTAAQVGTYTLVSVVGGAGCTGTVSGNATISEYPEPVATLSGSASICQGSGQTAGLTIDLTGTPPWTINWAEDGNDQAAVIANASPYTLQIGQAQAGAITLTGLTDGNGCIGTVSGSGTVTLNTAPTVSNIQINCDANNIFYTVSFNINGGDPSSYSVTPPNGTISGNTFTSNSLFSSTGYSFTVTDANNCNPVTVEQSIVVCDCETAAGEMDVTPINECGDGPVMAPYDNSNEFLEPNDVLVFVLHQGSGITIVPPVIGTYTSPVISFDQATMDYGVTYYLSAVAGDDNGSGGVDINDFCMDIAQGTPITFYEMPSATLSGNPVVCAGTPASLSVNFTGTNPWSITYTIGANAQTVNGITANPYTLVLNNPVTGSVCLTAMSDANCAGNFSGCSDVTVNTAVTISGTTTTCSPNGTTFTVSFTINGGDPAGYSVTPPDGTLAGNVFTSNPIPAGSGFSFVVTDANGCSPKTVAQTEVLCNCTTDVGTMTGGPVEECGDGPVSVNYDPTGEMLDSDDALTFILHTNSGTSPGTVLATNATPVFSFIPGTMNYGTTYYVSAVVGNSDGSGGVDLSDPCLALAHGVPVTFFEVPTATLSGSATICEGQSADLAIMFTGDQPWEVIIGGQTLSNIMTPDITHTVSPSSTTTYSLSGFTDDNCPGIVSGSATVTVNTPPSIVNASAACNPDTNTYSVTFDITGGDASSYIVTPSNGNLNGSTFTSNPIASDVVYQYIVDDANHCGKDTISGVMSCDCETNAGTMSPAVQNACVNESMSVPPATGFNLDSDDVLIYYLHTGSTGQLGTVIATNNLPEFNFDPNTMQPGVTYYVSAVAGNSDGMGGVNLNDFCLSIAPGTPVVWNSLPTISLIGSDAICEGQPAEVTMTMSGAGPYNVSYSIDGTPQTASNVTSPYSFDIFPSANTTVALISVTDNGAGCSNSASDTALIFVSQNVEAGTVTGDFTACDSDNETFNLLDKVSGAESGGVWTDANHNPVTGGVVSTGALAPGTYEFTYTVNASPPCYGDSVKVKVIINPNPVADAGPDQELNCDDTEATLGGINTTSGMSYDWTGGDVSNPATSNPVAGTAGNYTLTVTNPQTGCSDSDDVTISEKFSDIIPYLTVSGVSCFGMSDGFIFIDSITNGYPPYLISFEGGPFTQQTQFVNLSPDQYNLVIVDAAGCEKTLDLVTITEPDELNVELVLEIEGNENVISLGDSVNLVVVVNRPFDSLDAVIWTPAGIVLCDTCQENLISPSQTTNFSIMVDDDGCTDEDDITVYVRKDRPVYVPNAFSPNNDGTNDLFQIYAGKSVTKIKSFLVFNRWGETVYQYYNFQPNDPAIGWNGEHRGELMDPAVFTWFAEIEFVDGRVIMFEGDVTLVK